MRKLTICQKDWKNQRNYSNQQIAGFIKIYCHETKDCHNGSPLFSEVKILEIVKKEISLNVGQPNNFELICAMQGDNKTFEITATLYDVNKLYNVTTDNIKLKGVNPVGQNICMDIDRAAQHP